MTSVRRAFRNVNRQCNCVFEYNSGSPGDRKAERMKLKNVLIVTKDIERVLIEVGTLMR